MFGKIKHKMYVTFENINSSEERQALRELTVFCKGCYVSKKLSTQSENMDSLVKE